MKLLRLCGRLAAVTLLLSVSLSAAQAQVFSPIHRPVYTYYKEQVHPGSISGITFGVRAGVNVADWSGEAVQNLLTASNMTNGAVVKDTKTGFHAGVYAALPLGVSKRFVVEPGVLYSQKGINVMGLLPVQELEASNVPATASARMSYIDVPVLLKAYVTKGFYLYAGPQASYLISSKVQMTPDNAEFSGYKQDYNTKDQFRAFDLGVVGGLGYQFGSGLGFSAGYDYGLSSLDTNNRLNTQNRVFKAAMNFSF
jgi:hypothetical protein